MERRGWLDRLFGNLFQRVVGLSQVQVMSGYTPIFTPWGSHPYEADIVRAAVDAIARNAAKLRPRHIRRVDGDVIPVRDSSIERVLQFRPNPHMSTYDFLYKLISMTLLENNGFAFPLWENNRLVGIWPINCVGAEVLEDGAGQFYIKFYFMDRGHVTLPYSEVIHIRRHFYGNDVLGSPNTPIKTLLSVIHTTREGLAQAVKTSANLRGILKLTGMFKEADIEQQRERFVKEYMTVQNSGGIAALDSKADYIPLNNDPKMVDADHMRELREAVYRYFGVNDKIIMGNYSEEEWNAFYESVIEPLAIQLSLEFTGKLFSRQEIGFGNELIFEANRLQYASVQTKLALVSMVDRGAMTPNEWREVFNLGPIEGGDQPIRRLDTKPTDDSGGEGDVNPDEQEPAGDPDSGGSSPRPE